MGLEVTQAFPLTFCGALLTPSRAQSRQAIQSLDEAKDSIQALHVGPTYIMTGSVDGHVRTYDLRKGELRSDFIGRTSLFPPLCPAGTISLTQLRSPDPVTAVVPTKDHQSYLVTTLDSHVRLMDGSTGKLLNDFEGHLNTSYRCRACFGFNEASVVCGDENGAIWAWDLLDVSIQVSLPTRAWSSPNLPLITVFFLLASVMKSGDRLAAEPAPEGSRESDHMDRVPSHRSWRDDHRQRGRCN